MTRHSRTAFGLIGLVVSVSFPLVAASGGARSAGPEVAPPPREAFDNRVDRAWAEDAAERGSSDDPVKWNGVEWRVKPTVRRLVSTGRDVIDFEWSIRYTGRRLPLVIREPSLDRWGSGTYADLYAFPKGSRRGRMLTIRAPASHGLPIDIDLPVLPERGWYLRVRKGETATGRCTISVGDLKEMLVGKYPNEFSATVPPKFYAHLSHYPEDRGEGYELDAWTGTLPGSILVIPDLVGW